MMRCVVCGLLAIGICACGPTIGDLVRVRGASDIDCGDNVDAYPVRGGLWIAKGCGRWVEYTCFYSRLGNPICIRQSDAKSLPRPAAE